LHSRQYKSQPNVYFRRAQPQGPLFRQEGAFASQ